jgi:hypothetical protein
MTQRLHDLTECDDSIVGPAIAEDIAARLVKVLRLPEHNYMPADGTAFNFANYVVIPAIGASATVLSFVVPAGKNGVIEQIANNFVGGGFVDGSGNIIWRFEQDGVPLVGLENLNTSLGTPAAPSRTAPVRIMEGKTISLVVSNIAIIAAGQLIGGRISGHYYPRNTEQQGIWY